MSRILLSSTVNFGCSSYTYTYPLLIPIHGYCIISTWNPETFTASFSFVCQWYATLQILVVPSHPSHPHSAMRLWWTFEHHHRVLIESWDVLRCLEKLDRVYRACRIPRPVLVAGENLKWTQRAGSAGQSLPHRKKVDTSHCSMISMLLIVVQATAFALESEPSTDVHEGLSHHLCLKCKFLRYEWAPLLTTWQRTCAKTLRVSEGLWGARLSAAIVLDSKELLAGETWRDCDDSMTVMCGKMWEGLGRCVRCTRHPAKARASLWVQLSRPERSWKPLTNFQHKKLEKIWKNHEKSRKIWENWKL